MEDWASNTYPSAVGSRGSFFNRYGGTGSFNPSALLSSSTSQSSAAGDFATKNSLSNYVPFVRQYGANPYEPTRNYTAYLNSVKPSKGSVLNNFGANETIGQSQVENAGIQQFHPQMSQLLQPQKNMLQHMASANIAYGDTMFQSQQQKLPGSSYVVAPATAPNMQFPTSYGMPPAFHAKPFAVNHLPEKPVDVELLSKTPKNPFWKQEPNFLKSKTEESAAFFKQKEFENLLRQAVTMYHQLQHQYNAGQGQQQPQQPGTSDMHNLMAMMMSGQPAFSSNNAQPQNCQPHQGFHQNHYPSCPNFQNFDQGCDQQPHQRGHQNNQGTHPNQSSCCEAWGKPAANRRDNNNNNQRGGDIGHNRVDDDSLENLYDEITDCEGGANASLESNAEDMRRPIKKRTTFKSPNGYDDGSFNDRAMHREEGDKEYDQNESSASHSRNSRLGDKLSRPTKASNAKDNSSSNVRLRKSSSSAKEQHEQSYFQHHHQQQQQDKHSMLKSVLKRPKNLQPPNRKFMEAPAERSNSLGRYNRYFSDPTFDPTERFKRAQQRVDNLQKQVNSLDRPESMVKMSKSNSVANRSVKSGKKGSKGKEKGGVNLESYSDDEDEEEPVVKSMFSLMYDTDGRPLNQEAKQVQRELEEEYEEFKHRIPVATASTNPGPNSTLARMKAGDTKK